MLESVEETLYVNSIQQQRKKEAGEEDEEEEEVKEDPTLCVHEEDQNNLEYEVTFLYFNFFIFF